jgi:hypothetical protein
MDTQAIAPRRRLSTLFAEGVIIVVGVLFALAVDRAVIRSDERTLERSYLAGLASDMQATVAAATAAVADAETRDLAARSVLRAARADVPPGTAGLDVARALVRAGFVGDVSFVRETWDDIVGTGRLQLLRDDDLRRRLGSFYRS